MLVAVRQLNFRCQGGEKPKKSRAKLMTNKFQLINKVKVVNNLELNRQFGKCVIIIGV